MRSILWPKASLILFLLVARGLWANDAPVVLVQRFTGEGIGTPELQIFERLVASHVIEFGTFRVVDADSRELALVEYQNQLQLQPGAGELAPIELLQPDFVVSGLVVRSDELYIVSLETTKLANGEKFLVTEGFGSVNDIILQSRTLTRRLFMKNEAESESSGPASQDQPAISAATEFMVAPDQTKVSGTWRGDKNIESIRLFPNGTGVLVMSAGGTLRLKYRIEADTVVVEQAQANDPRMFRTTAIDHNLALRIAAEARPLRWEFKLAVDGSLLQGLKYGVAVRGTADNLDIDNSHVSDMTWFRVGR